MSDFYKINEIGRDFVVGDIHGCYDAFKEKLKEIDFDESKDRMFSVGDLIDRGNQNMECLELLLESWFFAVKGNHELMMCDALLRRTNWNLWARNGGDWCDKVDDIRLKFLAEKADKLPIAITLETINGKVGICHANPPADWGNVEDGVSSFHMLEEMLWGRYKLQYIIQDDVKNVDFTIHGHTPLSEIVAMGNSIYIDTGICYNGKPDRKGKISNTFLTVLNMSEPFDMENFKYKKS